MGYFTHNCKLTGVPIKDNAVLIVMKPNISYEYERDELMKYGKSCMISNSSTRFKYLPIWFPIHGKYDDYGRLEDIIEDDNTKIISEYYGLSIEKIIKIITCGRKADGFDDSLDVIKKPKVLPTGMKKGETYFHFYQRIMKDPMPNGGRYPQCPNNDYQVYRDGKYVSVSKEVYDADFKEIHDHNVRYNKWKETNPDTTNDYGNPQYEERYKDLLSYSAMWVHGDVYKRLTDIPNNDDYDKLDLGTPELLEYLGFKEIGRSDDNRHNRVFEKDGLIVNSDSNWINVHKESIYTLKQFKQYCNKMGVDIHIDELDKLGKIGQTYKLLIPSYKTNSDHYFKNDKDKLIDYYFLGGEFSNYGKLNIFTPLYIQAAKEGKLEDNLIRFWQFNKYMYAMGAYYEIVGTGPQDGEFKDVRDVLQISLDVTNEYIKYYEDEDGE